MVPVVVADEVEILALRRLQRGHQRIVPGISDRPGRQAGVAVSIVRRVAGQIRLMDGAAVAILHQRGVNHRGIGAQRHVTRQAVVIDAGHQWPLLARGGFFFHDGSHGDRAMRVGAQADLARFLAEAMHHGADHLRQTLGARELVGIGKKIAFQRCRAGINIGDERGLAARCLHKFLLGAYACLLHRRANVPNVVALRNHHGVDVNIAAR